MTKPVSHYPFRFPDGPITGAQLRDILGAWQRDILARYDIRNAQAFPDGISADNQGVTLGTAAKPAGRTVGVPALFTHISDAGRAASQRFLWPVTAANRNSAQDSASVLTATSGPSNSDISVAAHTVRFDFGTVSYGSGTISGLSASTLYYVYADDPDYAGGAVTYLATTNPQNLIAQGRYYVGSVTTPVTSSTGNITAATSANPVEFTTATAHGWTSGNTVALADLPGDFGTNLNGNNYPITVTGTTTFTVAVNGTGYAAYTSGGTATRVTTPSTGGGGAGGGGGSWYIEP